MSKITTSIAPPQRPVPTDRTTIAPAFDHKEVYLADVQPLTATGSHQLFTGHRADNGEKIFAKCNAFKSLVQGAGAAGLNTFIRQAARTIAPKMEQFQDTTEVVLTHVIKDNPQVFNFPNVASDEAVFVDPDTHQMRRGLVTPWVENVGTLLDHPSTEIVNPQQAVEGTLVGGILMGNWDNAFHLSNTVVVQADGHMSDGVPLYQGEYVSNDLGEGGHPFIGAWNVPHANQELLRQFPQYIDTAAQKIVHLKDEDIRDMVDRAGRDHVTGWNADLSRYYSQVLMSNRDQLAHKLQHDPQWLHPAEGHNWLADSAWTHDQKQKVYGLAAIRNFVQVEMSGIMNKLPDAQAILADMRPFPSATIKTTPPA